MLLAHAAAGAPDKETLLSWCRQVRGPVVVMHGSDDLVVPVARGEALAEAISGEFVLLEGCGHITRR